MLEVANTLARYTQLVSRSETRKTPFAVAAGQARYKTMGGKMDDITVITALVQAN